MSLNEVDPAANRTTANGTTTVFPYTFQITLKTDIEVLVDATVKTVDTDFSVDGLGVSGGGNVTMFSAPINGAIVTRLRKQPASQLSIYTPNEGFPHERVMADLDKLAMQIQQVKEQLHRGFFLPKYSSLSDQGIDVPTVGAFARGKSGGGIDWATPANAGALSSPVAISDGGTGATTAAGARTALGVDPAGTGIAAAVVDAKGDLLVGSAADTVSRKAVGADATVLIGLAAGVNGLHYQAGLLNARALIGGRLTVTMAANAITIAVKTDAGNDPSTTEPVWVPFRHAMLTDGSTVLLPITAALSLVVSSGSTLGTVSGIAHRLYVGVANDASTLRLFVYNPLDSSLNHQAIGDEMIVVSTAEGGAGGADAAHTLYSGTAFTDKAIRVLGYFESVQATAGTWATAASKVQLMGAGVRPSGHEIQRWRVASGTVATGTTATPIDNSIPQITEGDEYLSRTMVPQSVMSLLEITAHAVLAQSNAANSLVLALHQDAIANALKAVPVNGLGANEVIHIPLAHKMLAGVITTMTFRLRAGNAAGSTTTFNGAAGAQLMGGVADSFLEIREIHI